MPGNQPTFGTTTELETHRGGAPTTLEHGPVAKTAEGADHIPSVSLPSSAPTPTHAGLGSVPPSGVPGTAPLGATPVITVPHAGPGIDASPFETSAPHAGPGIDASTLETSAPHAASAIGTSAPETSAPHAGPATEADSLGIGLPWTIPDTLKNGGQSTALLGSSGIPAVSAGEAGPSLPAPPMSADTCKNGLSSSLQRWLGVAAVLCAVFGLGMVFGYEQGRSSVSPAAQPESAVGESNAGQAEPGRPEPPRTPPIRHHGADPESTQPENPAAASPSQAKPTASVAAAKTQRPETKASANNPSTTPESGRVTINVVPRSAKIYRAGRVAERQPVTYEIEKGSPLLVEVRAYGYKPKRVRLDGSRSDVLVKLTRKAAQPPSVD
ncbi:hypothetical protein ACFL5O_05265 [Myxococcota bacterium]